MSNYCPQTKYLAAYHVHVTCAPDIVEDMSTTYNTTDVEFALLTLTFSIRRPIFITFVIGRYTFQQYTSATAAVCGEKLQ